MKKLLLALLLVSGVVHAATPKRAIQLYDVAGEWNVYFTPWTLMESYCVLNINIRTPSTINCYGAGFHTLTSVHGSIVETNYLELEDALSTVNPLSLGVHLSDDHTIGIGSGQIGAVRAPVMMVRVKK